VACAYVQACWRAVPAAPQHALSGASAAGAACPPTRALAVAFGGFIPPALRAQRYSYAELRRKKGLITVRPFAAFGRGYYQRIGMSFLDPSVGAAGTVWRFDEGWVQVWCPIRASCMPRFSDLAPRCRFGSGQAQWLGPSVQARCRAGSVAGLLGAGSVQGALGEGSGEGSVKAIFLPFW